MSISTALRRAPGRIAAGAFILNSGLGKWRADDGTAAYLHGTATTAYPFLGKIPPAVFTKALAAGEITVGAALLSPFVPAVAAGALLTGFSGALLGMYARLPGMHDRNMRPTPDGIALAKDVWMAGIGVGLVVDGVLSRGSDRPEPQVETTT